MIEKILEEFDDKSNRDWVDGGWCGIEDESRKEIDPELVRDFLLSKLTDVREATIDEVEHLAGKLISENSEKSHTFKECGNIHIGRDEALHDFLHDLKSLRHKEESKG